MAKAKASARATSPAVARKAAPTSSAQPLTMEERLHRIETMRIRIDGYIQFMCRIAELSGTSNEIKQRAVTLSTTNSDSNDRSHGSASHH
jgi:hypothetical protein